MDKTEETPDGNEASAKLVGAVSMINEEDNEVMKAIADMKTFFSSKFEGVLNAIQEIKNDISEFGGRISEAEHRISETEDNVEKLQKTVNVMEHQIATLTSDLDDLENRNRRCNLRLVNLPEKVEGKDAVNFLEKWLSDVFGASTFPSPVVIERAHRIGKPPTKPQHYPRILIMKFLNFRDRQRVIQAAREMGTVWGTQSDVFPRLLSSGEETTKGIRWCEEASSDIKHLIQICLSSQTERAV